MMVNCSLARSFATKTRHASATSESSTNVPAGWTSRSGVGSFGDPIQQNRAQPLEYLASSRSDMKTRRTSFELSEGFLCSFRILKKFNSDFGGMRRASRDNPLKYRTHRSHSSVECRCEIAGRQEAKAARDPAQWVWLVRNSVGLLFGFDLQAVR